MAEQSQNDPQDTRGGDGETPRRMDTEQQAAPRPPLQGDKIDESMNTDGAGTGGVGADAGGYGPIPGSESTG